MASREICPAAFGPDTGKLSFASPVALLVLIEPEGTPAAIGVPSSSAAELV
jgi:hypothetical protein